VNLEPGYRHAIQAIRELSGVTLPDIEHLVHRQFKPSNPELVQPSVPCAPRDPKKPDLRLLRGDLDNEEHPSAALKEIEKIIDENQSTRVCIPLIALSGTGKTKAMFDLGRKRCVFATPISIHSGKTIYLFWLCIRFMIYISTVYSKMKAAENDQKDTERMLKHLYEVISIYQLHNLNRIPNPSFVVV